MRTIYLVVLSLVVFSCQNQTKLDLEKEKQAAIDSVKVEMEKQRLIDSMRVEMAQSKKEKEVVIVNQSGQASAPTKRKGWSNTAKGAVIGAGVGAVTGAVVSKKKAEGAIIGGLAGAAVGAGTGAVIDDKKK